MIPTLLAATLAIGQVAADADPLAEHLKRYEGFSEVPYTDTFPHFSIGWGHQCSVDHPIITPEQGDELLRQDIAKARAGARRVIPDLDTHPPAVILAVEAMCFQLGVAGVYCFVSFRTCLARRDYLRAASEMVNSRWASQTPARAHELAANVAVARNTP